VLHYGHAGAPNDCPLKDGMIGLLDMGAEYHCYCADITCSYPINGKFTEDQKGIYQGVLNAVEAVENAMKPGMSWKKMHELALLTITEQLINMGILKGDAKTIVDKDLAAKFMPHGLGHLIGLNTHDVGGYLRDHPERSNRPGFRSLRTSRDLEENMVLTVEPGIYFIESQVEEVMASEEFAEFVNKERLAQFRGFGGVRIEDVVLVTSDGIENFTQTPRTIEEVESVMAGGAWPPAEDKMPQLRRQWTDWSKLNSAK
jgi:Xaa-Pro dipeptidase